MSDGSQGFRVLYGGLVTGGESFCFSRVRKLKVAPRAAMRGNVSAASRWHSWTTGNCSVGVIQSGVSRGGPPKSCAKMLIKWQLTSRLETRTKESNMHVSVMVENHLYA